jgi:hypothetical protein
VTTAALGPCCSVGAHPDTAAIDTALRAGQGIRVVAKRFGPKKSAIADHRRKCLKLEGKVEPTEPAYSDEAPEPDSAPDRVSESCPEKVQTSGDDARVRSKPDPKTLDSFEDRVGYVATLIASGHYSGRPTANRLAALWNVDRGTVQNYHRAAALLAKADRGAIEETREASLGYWSRIRAKALAEDDLKAAAAAQAGYDRAAGVVESGGAKLQINLMQAQGFDEFLAIILDGLAMHHPEALPTIKGLVRAHLIERRQTAIAPKLRALPGGR